MTHVLHTARISNVDSIMFVHRFNRFFIYKYNGFQQRHTSSKSYKYNCVAHTGVLQVKQGKKEMTINHTTAVE